MASEIDSSNAGKHAQDFGEGALRFCDAHPLENWEITGVLDQYGVSVNATNGNRSLVAKIVPPGDMANSVFKALEDFRNRKGECPFRDGEFVFYRPTRRLRDHLVMTSLASLQAGTKYKIAKISHQKYVTVEGFENDPGGGLHWEAFSSE